MQFQLEKYQDKSKFNSKVQKPLFASYNMLVNAKPEHMEMKDFLRGCITADLENKLNLDLFQIQLILLFSYSFSINISCDLA